MSGVRIESRNAGTREKDVAMAYQNTIIINTIWYYFIRYWKSIMKFNYHEQKFHE